MRLIDADKLKNWFNDHGIDTVYKHCPECEEDAVDEVVILIDDAPTIDPVRHGKWIETYDDGIPYYRCSACNTDFKIDYAIGCKYCCECGAKMDGE